MPYYNRDPKGTLILTASLRKVVGPRAWGAGFELSGSEPYFGFGVSGPSYFEDNVADSAFVSDWF